LTVSPEDFRLAMRKLTASVTVITAAHEGARGGLTASAVCSVSFEPLTMLACINRAASCFPLIDASRKCAVNLLTAEDVAIANQFGSSGSPDPRFTVGDWHDVDGLPVLKSAAATILLNVNAHHDSGTHRVFFGDVTHVTLAKTARALLYEDGHYCSSQPL